MDKPSQPDTGSSAGNNVLPLNGPTRLRFWGVRGSIPSPGWQTARYGGNTSCVEVRTDGQIIVLDAGSGIRPLGLELAREFGQRPLAVTLLITHTHWDHIQGFPFFVPAYQSQNSVTILGYEGARHGLEETLSGQMESPYFPIGLKEMPGNIMFRELKDLNFSIGNLQVQAAYTNHPGVCVGYRLQTHDGVVTFVPDNEHFERLRAQPGKGLCSSAEAIEYARSRDQRIAEFVSGSDILIMDSQYDENEYSSHIGWGHSCADDTVNLAIRAGVKHLFMFHHDPAHDDAKIRAMEKHARELARSAGSRMRVEAAREGREVILDGGKVRFVRAIRGGKERELTRRDNA